MQSSSHFTSTWYFNSCIFFLISCSPRPSYSSIVIILKCCTFFHDSMMHAPSTTPLDSFMSNLLLSQHSLHASMNGTAMHSLVVVVDRAPCSNNNRHTFGGGNFSCNAPSPTSTTHTLHSDLRWQTGSHLIGGQNPKPPTAPGRRAPPPPPPIYSELEEERETGTRLIMPCAAWKQCSRVDAHLGTIFQKLRTAWQRSSLSASLDHNNYRRDFDSIIIRRCTLNYVFLLIVQCWKNFVMQSTICDYNTAIFYHSRSCKPERLTVPIGHLAPRFLDQYNSCGMIPYIFSITWQSKIESCFSTGYHGILGLRIHKHYRVDADSFGDGLLGGMISMASLETLN